MGFGVWPSEALSFEDGSGFNALVSGAEICGFGLGFGDGLGSLAYWCRVRLVDDLQDTTWKTKRRKDQGLAA